MAKATPTTYSEDAVPSDHRQLLSSLNENRPEDSSTDQDDLSDVLPDDENLKSNSLPQDDVVGISIGRAQTYLRSPETSAIEKTRVLEAQDAYFIAVTPDEEVKEPSSGEPLPSSKSDISQEPLPTEGPKQSISQEPQRPLSPWRAHPPQQTRKSSIMRSVLGETAGNNRKRSSSGSMLDSLMKLFPELPSISVLRGAPSPLSQDHTASINHAGVNEPTAGDLEWTSQEPFKRKSVSPDAALSRTRSRSSAALLSPGLDGSVESLLGSTTPTSSRTRQHRSNSDNSLYLSRKPTSLSAYDDTSAYADVAEMHNARFKAITDSFQNSTLRLPKLPSIKPSSPGRSINPVQDARDEITRQNTHANTGSTRTPKSYYANIKNIRNTKDKKIAEHVESPQQRAHPILSEALKRTEGDVVVMGGYRGSILRDAKPPHRQLWAPVKVGLNLRNANLEVGLTRDDEERAEEKIIPSGTLSHIGPIDICRRLLKHLRKCPNTREGKLRVHDWGYDWRLSPDLLAGRLIKFLEGLECNQPGAPAEKRGATIIAHSLGGLLTRYAVNQRPELFAGVVYAGVPQNCVNILGPLRNGDDVLLSSRVLTAQVNFTMRTSFALLPEDGRCFIQRNTNKRYDLDFFDSRTWEEFRLSPCINYPLDAALRGKDHRKSLIGSLQESLTSTLPSLPSVGKPSSWFGGTPREESPAGTSGSNREAAKDTAENALHMMGSPEDIAPGMAGEASLEPSMKKNSYKGSIATACTLELAEAREYLARTLAGVLAFKQALVHLPELQKANNYPPHAFIFGKTVPTVYGAKVSSREAIKYTDAFDDLAFAAGDGVVLASAAQLPEGYKCVKGGRVETDRGHVGLLGDLEGVGKCLGAIVEARKRGVGMGNYT